MIQTPFLITPDKNLLLIVLSVFFCFLLGFLLRVISHLMPSQNERSFYGYLCSVGQAPIWHFIILEMLVFVMSWLVMCKTGMSYTSLWLLLLTRWLLTLSYIDFRQKRLPDSLTLPLLWLGLILNSGDFLINLKNSVWGAVAGYLSLWGMYWCYKFLTKKEGVGYGDLKLFAALGAWGGVSILLPTFIFASFFAAFISTCYALIKQGSIQKNMAFGPYLAFFGWLNIFLFILKI